MVRIISAKKGDLYEQIEMDMRAVLNGKIGDVLLNKDNEYKNDIEIHIIRKRTS